MTSALFNPVKENVIAPFLFYSVTEDRSADFQYRLYAYYSVVLLLV